MKLFIACVLALISSSLISSAFQSYKIFFGLLFMFGFFIFLINAVGYMINQWSELICTKINNTHSEVINVKKMIDGSLSERK